MIFTHEEKKYGVKYRLVPDHKIMGQKFKKDAAKLRKALPLLSYEETMKFISEKQLVVEGLLLTTEELSIQRYFDSSSNELLQDVGSNQDGIKPQYETSSDSNTLILMDIASVPSLFQEGLAREFINRCQRLRKKMGLKPTDEIGLYYDILSDVNDQLKDMIKNQLEYLEKNMKLKVEELSKKNGEFLVSEEQDIHGSKVNFTLTRH